MIELREGILDTLVNGADVVGVQAHLVVLVLIQLVLLAQHLLQVFQQLFHRGHLLVGLFLQLLYLTVQAVHRRLNLVLAPLARKGRRELQALVSMDTDASPVGHQGWCLGEGTVTLVTLNRNAAGLRDNLRSSAHHVLLTVDAGIDGCLTDLNKVV